MIRYKNIKGFTLAEIIITLTIVGVIAAMTIPDMVTNIQEQTWKTQYRKAFSIASQAWNMALNDNIIQSRHSEDDDNVNSYNFNSFKSQFNIIKQCYSSNISECWANGEMFWASEPDNTALAFIDSSGMAWSMTCRNWCWNHILVDTNGFAGPNKYGRDRFEFYPFTEDNSYGAGLPIKINPSIGDRVTPESNSCPSGKCYYKSWLLN